MKNYNLLQDINIYYTGCEQCEAGYSYGPAIRPHYLLHFVLGGKGHFHTGGRTYDLKEGDVFLIHPGVSAYYQADAANPWKYVWVSLGGRDAEYLLTSCGFSFKEPVFYRIAKQNGELWEQQKGDIERMADSYLERNYNELKKRGYLYLILSELRQAEREGTDARKKMYLQKACEYISYNYYYEIKVHDIAHHIGIDRTYLYRIFMEEKNISPLQYMIAYRIQIAADMLHKTDMMVTEIAFSCGFRDAPSFCRHFKKATGLTPVQYRKSGKVSLLVSDGAV